MNSQEENEGFRTFVDILKYWKREDDWQISIQYFRDKIKNKEQGYLCQRMIWETDEEQKTFEFNGNYSVFTFGVIADSINLMENPIRIYEKMEFNGS